jgi:hypothetical protein
MKFIILVQGERLNTQALILETLNIFVNCDEKIILCTFIRAPMKALMKNMKIGVKRVNHKLNGHDGLNYHKKVL